VKKLTFGLKVLAVSPDMSPTMEAPKRTDTKTRVETVQRSAEGMHSCPTCSSVLVQPVNWHEQGDGAWNVELRCPECEWWGRDTYSQAEVDRYDEELDRGGQELIEDLRSLTRANMEEEADRLRMALATDCILPEDF
jgi:RNase P subunit RPR2